MQKADEKAVIYMAGLATQCTMLVTDTAAPRNR